MRHRLLTQIALLALAVSTALPAWAQQPPNDSNINFQGALKKKPPEPRAPDVPAPQMSWPRLDSGTTICRSADDLLRRAAIMRGELAGGADCRVLSQPVAIQILQRLGPGRTEVQLSTTKETGWTDAWVPATPPPGAVPASAR